MTFLLPRAGNGWQEGVGVTTPGARVIGPDRAPFHCTDLPAVR